MSVQSFTITRILKSVLLSLFILPFSIVMGQNCANVDFSFEIQNNTVSFSGTSTSNVIEWYWNFGDGSSERGQNAKHNFTKPGSYNVCLKVIAVSPVATSNTPCTGIVCKKISIGTSTDTNDDCGISADFEYKADENSISATGKSSDEGAEYFWYISNVDGQYTGKSVDLKVGKPGVYELCMVVLNSAKDCKVLICKRIEIKNSCDIEADFSYQSDGSVIKFTAKSSSLNAVYFWEFGDGTSESGSIVKHIYNQDGFFNVCLTVRDPAKVCSVKICKKVELSKTCNLRADFKFETRNSTVTFRGIATQSGLKYFWDFGDGNRGEGASAQNEYKTRGIYVVCLTVVDEANQCKTQICKRVLVGRPVFGPNVISTDAGDLFPLISIYPNPAKDFIRIDAKQVIASIEIFNSFNGLMYSANVNELTHTVDISGWQEGIYMVQIIMEDGSRIVKRFYKN
ncbi:MAG: PKD domain-containing protein [Saprospiraceae bacterium]|nr:PKD domain-containing protein [Saprospiraceae bacterium]